jgi:hypothetical protein
MSFYYILISLVVFALLPLLQPPCPQVEAEDAIFAATQIPPVPQSPKSEASRHFICPTGPQMTGGKIVKKETVRKAHWLLWAVSTSFELIEKLEDKET